MSNLLDAPYEMTEILSFRVPPVVLDAMRVDSKKQMCSVSDVARQLVLAGLRSRGLLEET
jgi:hypothetical protein